MGRAAYENRIGGTLDPVAGRLLLLSLPPLVIAAGGLRGCRPAERPIAMGIATGAGAVLAASLLLLDAEGSALLAGAAYGSMVIFTGALAMLIRRRPGPDGPGGGGGGSPQEPPPFDWDDFERRFWADVRRRASSRGGTPGSGRSPSRAPSAR